eukprot:2525310-Lingulodinium_polyedra.AAC.1
MLWVARVSEWSGISVLGKPSGAPPRNGHSAHCSLFMVRSVLCPLFTVDCSMFILHVHCSLIVAH